jgi:hypothetical protein
MRRCIAALIFGAIFLFARHAFAAEPHAARHPETSHAADHSTVDAFPHPRISDDGSWAGAMVILILLGFFLPAAVIGPIVRANTPEEVPPAHSHDEPPGTSHHHGSSGTHAEEPHH